MRRLGMGIIDSWKSTFIEAICRTANNMIAIKKLLCEPLDSNFTTTLAPKKKHNLIDNRLYTSLKEMLRHKITFLHSRSIGFADFVTNNPAYSAPSYDGP